MKNPNGYGSVVKLSGNRRNPYTARKTKGWNDKGQPIYITIGYYPDRKTALAALGDFNKNPYDVDASKITFSELYENWMQREGCKLGTGTINSLKSAYKHCSQLYKMKYKDIRKYHMQSCIDECGCGYSTQWAIKNLFGHLESYALETDVIMKGYYKNLQAAPVEPTKKQPFSDDEVKAMWAAYNSKEEWADSVVFLLYTGFRINEMLSLKVENINLEEGYMIGGSKTVAGRNRTVPIHSKILPIVEARVAEGNEYLFSYNGKQMCQATYRNFWTGIMKSHDISHTPHECRHTLRSRLDSAGANKVCIDRIMGHSSSDTGERIYTHKSIQELKDAIELITN